MKRQMDQQMQQYQKRVKDLEPLGLHLLTQMHSSDQSARRGEEKIISEKLIVEASCRAHRSGLQILVPGTFFTSSLTSWRKIGTFLTLLACLRNAGSYSSDERQFIFPV